MDVLKKSLKTLAVLAVLASPEFWVCVRFRTSLLLRARTVTTFDVSAPATTDLDAQVAHMRRIRREGAEWLPGPDPLPHGVPAGLLEAVWVERFNEENQTVCVPPTVRK